MSWFDDFFSTKIVHFYRFFFVKLRWFCPTLLQNVVSWRIILTLKNCTFLTTGLKCLNFDAKNRFFWQFFNQCENLLEFLTFYCGIRAVICDAVILFFLNTTLVRIHVWLLLLLTRPSTEQYKSQKPYINLFSIKRRDKDKEEAAVEPLVNSP